MLDQYLNLKIAQAKRKLWQLSSLTWGASRRKLSKLINGSVDPMLLYAVPIWVDATWRGVKISQLRSIQRLMLTPITTDFRTISEKAGIVISSSVPIEMETDCEIVIKRKKGPFTSQLYSIRNIFAICDIDPIRKGSFKK